MFFIFFPTKLPIKLKNLHLLFFSCIFVATKPTKLQRPTKYKDMPTSIYKRKTFNKIFLRFETKNKPRFSTPMQNKIQYSTHIFLCFIRNQTQNPNLKSMNKTLDYKQQIATQPHNQNQDNPHHL